MRKLLVTALLTSPLLALAAPTNLVANGGFEDPEVDAGSYVVGPVPGWDVPIEVRDANFGRAHSGNNFAEVDRTFSQTVNTVAGQTYQFSFYYSSRPEATVAGEGVSYSLGAGDVVLPTLPFLGFDASQYAAAWTLYTTNFIATSDHTTLTFNALGQDDGFGASLDDVSITAVPEPSAYALMIAGLAAVGTVARRNRKKL
jgi:hypothetical protein